jgi:hypothetical protein
MRDARHAGAADAIAVTSNSIAIAPAKLSGPAAESPRTVCASSQPARARD